MPSALLVRDMLEAEDAGFLAAFLALGGAHNESDALSVVKPWLAAARPWARAQLLAYVADGCDRPGHRRVVRALLRHAEAGDDELLGALAAALDGSLRTVLKKSSRWDWQTREQVTRRIRRIATRAAFRAKRPHTEWVRGVGLRKTGAMDPVETGGRFSIVTRRYLRRRVVRALRALEDEPARYLRAAASLLVRTPAARVADPAGLLDARALLTVIARHADALVFSPHTVEVREGARLAELAFAPLFPDAWAAHGVEALLTVVSEAPAPLVRRFAAQQLQKVLPELPITRLRALLRSPHDEARAAALVLLSVADSADVDAAAWIALLDVDDPAIASALAARAADVLGAATLPLPTIVTLCRAPAAPVALLAARLLAAYADAHADAFDVRTALGALEAEVPAARALVLETLAPRIAATGDALLVRDLLDSPHVDVRARGVALLREPAYQDAPALWVALTESPFADLRAALLAHLERRRDALGPHALLGVCAAALLDCLRGSRQRARALALATSLLADKLATHQPEAALAAPLVSLAMRSVRAADRRAALAVVVREGWRSPHTRGTFVRLLGVAVPDPKDLEVQA